MGTQGKAVETQVKTDDLDSLRESTSQLHAPGSDAADATVAGMRDQNTNGQACFRHPPLLR